VGGLSGSSSIIRNVVKLTPPLRHRQQGSPLLACAIKDPWSLSGHFHIRIRIRDEKLKIVAQPISAIICPLKIEKLCSSAWNAKLKRVNNLQSEDSKIGKSKSQSSSFAEAKRSQDGKEEGRFGRGAAKGMKCKHQGPRQDFWKRKASGKAESFCA
jgi:hypothetical protein